MKFRLHVFAWHLMASLVLALLSSVLIYGIWYPAPLHQALGVTTIFMMLLGILLIVGPLLTLIISKEGKKSFKFDIAVIVVLQLSAFGYGMKTVADGRPLWIVFHNDRFNVVQAYQLDPSLRRAAHGESKYLGITGPEWVGTRLPTDTKELNELIFGTNAGSVDLFLRPHLYSPLAESYSNIQKKALPLERLYQYNPTEIVEQNLELWPAADAFLPVLSRVQPMTVLIQSATGEVVAIVPLRPWQ